MAEDTDKCPWCDSHISVSQSAEVREEFYQLVQEVAAAKKRIQTLTEQLTTAKQEQRVLRSKADELTKPGKAARHHCPGCAAEIAESLVNEIELSRNNLRKQVAAANAEAAMLADDLSAVEQSISILRSCVAPPIQLNLDNEIYKLIT